MPTNRIRRRRSRRKETPDAVAAVRRGEAVEYSPDAFDALVGVIWFGEGAELEPTDAARAMDMLRQWLPQQEAAEAAAR